MPVNKKWKAEVKERIRLSNEQVKMGYPPDPWVVEFRQKNNKIKTAWKEKQPLRIPKQKKANSGSFKKGLVPHNKKTEAEIEKSRRKWKEGTRRWAKENKASINEKMRLKRKNDVSFRLKCRLRSTLSKRLRNKLAKKSAKTFELLGCDIEFFLNHLEAKFKEGMSFDNYGLWEIDHIIPCDRFDLTDSGQQEICFHYSNLQPLWAIENRIKSNKILAA